MLFGVDDILMRSLASITLSIAITVALSAQQQQQQQSRPGPQQPARDTSAQQSKDAPPTPAGRITGRVLAADNGRPVKRARVFASAAELPGGRGVLTDESGVYELADVLAGWDAESGCVAVFVAQSDGHRRPLLAGTPLYLGEA